MEGPNWPFRCSDISDIYKLSQLPILSKCFHSTSYKCWIKSSHVTVSVLVHLCHDDIAGLCFLSMWNNKDIKSRSNPRLCTHTLPPPFLSPIKKKPNSQKKLNMAVYLEISCKFLMFRSLRLPNNVTTHNSFLVIVFQLMLDFFLYCVCVCVSWDCDCPAPPPLVLLPPLWTQHGLLLSSLVWDISSRFSFLKHKHCVPLCPKSLTVIKCTCISVKILWVHWNVAALNIWVSVYLPSWLQSGI